MSDRPVAPWLWRGGVGLLALVVAIGAALVIALALGLNSPRPLRPPDWETSNLPLVLEAPSNTTAQRLLGRSCADLTLEIEMTPLPGPNPSEETYAVPREYGLVYRAQDNDHYYAFVIGSDGYYAILQVAEEIVTLVDWQQYPHIHRGLQTNRLRVACTGATCDCFINDEYATTIEDSSWLEGDVGLWVRGCDGGSTTVKFHSARVWVEQ
jgi:hypothetical protein